MNSPAEKLSPVAQKLLQLDNRPAWRLDFLRELAVELREYRDQHLHELPAREVYVLERGQWLVSCAQMLTASELAFILCELYEPSQLAFTLGHIAAHQVASATMVLATMESPEVKS
jgi:hypothetical protein